MTSPDLDWKKRAAAKKAQQELAIPKEWLIKDLPSKETLNVIDIPESCGILTAKEIQITTSDVSLLLKNLAGAVWTSVEVTTAFAKRAVIAHQLVNCLTEVFIDRALERAAHLDNVLKTTGKVVGPLHGLPISLKDQINIKDIETTMGYVSWIGKKPAKNSVLVDILEASGAVLYVKTNVPQTLMWLETFNWVFGRTVNPWNRSLTSGGSSGGEGALLALKGSPLGNVQTSFVARIKADVRDPSGVGTDVAGSIRIPAAFCGLYGLKPSIGRVPFTGNVTCLEGHDGLHLTTGPLAHSMDAVKLFMQSVVDQKPWNKDSLAVRKPWNEDEYNLADRGGKDGKLCFAIMWDDQFVRPHPPVLRGLEETKKALLAAGHSVIDWVPQVKHIDVIAAIGAMWAAGALQDFTEAAAPSGEPLVKSMKVEGEDPAYEPDDIPGFRLSDGMPAYALWQFQKRRQELRQEYLEHWNATVSATGTGRPIDAIICPCAPFVAPPHGGSTYINYMGVWNALDYVALTIPTGLSVDSKLDAPVARQEFFNDMDKANHDLYDPHVYQNAPIGIQVVGRTLEEEAVIAMGQIVDAALKTRLSSA